MAKLNLDTLEMSSETAVSEHWKSYHNDIVLRCNTQDQKEAYIYILVEHQSTPDVFLPIRMLHYKLNTLHKLMDQYKEVQKLPNIIGLVIYNGKEVYPYAMDIYSCFEDPKLAKTDITQPMLMVDLAHLQEQETLSGHDGVMKLLLKISRERDFITKPQKHMRDYPLIFVNLSEQQAKIVYEYTLFVGKGTPKNAEDMKKIMKAVYGQDRSEKIFTLMDYYQEEAKKQGMLKGKLEGIKQTIALLEKQKVDPSLIEALKKDLQKIMTEKA